MKDKKLQKILILSGVASVAFLLIFLTYLPLFRPYQFIAWIIVVALLILDLILGLMFFNRKSPSTKSSDAEGDII